MARPTISLNRIPMLHLPFASAVGRIDSGAVMKILLSNDDGILAPGLAALHAAVADLGDVTVVAPESVQSAAGHSITLRAPLTVQRVHVDGPNGFSGLSVDGRPADCVRLAVLNILEERPEWHRPR